MSKINNIPSRQWKTVSKHEFSFSENNNKHDKVSSQLRDLDARNKENP
jgi:hypothetical protein